MMSVVRVLLVGVVVAACGSSDETLRFPPTFRFGTAISGFQADMGCPTLPPSQCDDPNSDWYQFVTSPVTVGKESNHLSGDPLSWGPGHWELYETDFDIAKNELGTDALRLSFEWSRIFPTATDGIEGQEALKAVASSEAIAHYHAVLAALKARGLSPLVTLNHYTLPAWIHDAVGCNQDLSTCSPRGWVDRERTVTEIAKYARFCAREFGGEVDQWVTLNEPFPGVMLTGYIFPSADRVSPPGVGVRIAEAKIVYRAIIEAHARMYDAVKAADTQDADGDGVAAEIGVVHPMTPVAPLDPSNPKDVKAAENIFYLFNLAYLNAVAKGEYDENIDGNAVLREDLAGRMDFIGLNYYTRITVEGLDNSILPAFSPLMTFNPLTFVVWELYPRGIYEMAMVIKEMGLPIIITENGLLADPPAGEDASSALVAHLTWVARAIRDGADIRGYYYWTLTDNYEWNHGMNKRLGLYGIDTQDPTKRRMKRPVADTYRTIIQTRTIRGRS